MKPDETPLLFWKMSDYALTKAKDGMDHRAKVEEERVMKGEQIIVVHSEALRDFDDIKQLIQGGLKFLQLMKTNIKGEAADLGSGTGMGATILSYESDFDKIYAVEFSEQFCTRIMPDVFDKFKADFKKINRVVGDFNNLEVPDNSISLLLDVDSFHHSEDLNITFKECHRVLKQGGVIISIDRAWPNSVSREELDRKLDVEFSDKWKTLYGIPTSQIFRRRDYGEHEYTINEWSQYYANNGFTVFVFTQIHPPILNRLFLKLPTFELSIRIASIRAKLGFKRHFIYGFNPIKKLFVAIKT